MEDINEEENIKDIERRRFIKSHTKRVSVMDVEIKACTDEITNNYKGINWENIKENIDDSTPEVMKIDNNLLRRLKRQFTKNT